MARVNYKVPSTIFSDNDDLLRIIHNGIDDIIVKLKNAVDVKGEGVGQVGEIARTNAAVKKIVEVFNDFQRGVVPEKGPMKETDINVDKSPIITSNFLRPNHYGSNIAVLISNLNKSTYTLPETILQEADILDLNTGINYNTYDNTGVREIDISNDKKPLNERLINCSTLETLYLRKHKEIIRIFIFVINLFDKYKYAIKVILFLLKNLVRAEQNQKTPDTPDTPDTPGKSVSVKLPKPFITNIKLLLKDQANIQTIIDGMETVVKDTHSSTSVDSFNEVDINQNLQNQNSPPKPPPARAVRVRRQSV